MLLYHGSCIDFDKFDIDAKQTSRIRTHGPAVYCTANYDLAKCFCKESGFIYHVEVNMTNVKAVKNFYSTDIVDGYIYEMPCVDSKKSITCYAIFNTDIIEIVKKEKI